MKDKFGRVFFTENEAVRLVYKKPKVSLEDVLLEDPTKFNKAVEDLYSSIPKIKKYTELEQSIEEFDKARQSDWFMPKEYADFDIAKWVLDQCKGDAELQRAGQELMAFQDRGLMPLLNFMYYLVQTMKQHNIVWGVGRGSSVASFCLFLIGVHKINPLLYNLDITEFLR